MTTKRATFRQRRSCIPFASLPLTFQHAVQTTRELKVRYLWIDSLCIIQDSADDWAVESGRMGDIYMHSYVTLAADSSGSSHGGLFNSQSVLQDEEPLGKHLELEILVGTDLSKKSCRLYISDERAVPSNVDSSGPLEGVDDSDKDDPDRMLVTRGWTLQEAILPARVLHFTSKQLIWECPRKGYEAEDMFSANLRHMRPTFTEMSAKLMPLLDDGEGSGFNSPAQGLRDRPAEVLWAWYGEVIEYRYSSRCLTYPTDKLPAIAGLAVLASQTLKCEYIAGMWRRELEWALTWPGWFSRQVVTLVPGGWKEFKFNSCGRVTGKIHLDRGLDNTTDGGQAETFSVLCFELGIGSGPETKVMPRWICLLILAPIQGQQECYTRLGLANWEWDEQSEACMKYAGLREWRAIDIH
ncbi:hypothetical protein SLS58_005010 [Diplodia intermedia]|uniref:Heterokaryon incompatibility domain-containing protein n=1 Tax=Diplodia intermedia TaxID=856260 RepID=A0ABR3TT46_9PEZI